MPENVDRSSATKARTVPQANRHPMILRASSLVVGSILSLLMLIAIVPPIVTELCDSAVVTAPVTLLTPPIDGEIASLAISPGRTLEAGDSLAQISIFLLDRGTLTSLEDY